MTQMALWEFYSQFDVRVVHKLFTTKKEHKIAKNQISDRQTAHRV